MTLNDILQSAQGGRAVDNLAARFGRSEGEAPAATHAMIGVAATRWPSSCGFRAALSGRGVGRRSRISNVQSLRRLRAHLQWGDGLTI
jgi:hypothetical protein